MKIGDIVYIKAYKDMVGEVKAIDDYDRVCVDLYGTNLQIWVDIVDLGVNISGGEKCNE